MWDPRDQRRGPSAGFGRRPQAARRAPTLPPGYYRTKIQVPIDGRIASGSNLIHWNNWQTAPKLAGVPTQAHAEHVISSRYNTLLQQRGLPGPLLSSHGPIPMAPPSANEQPPAVFHHYHDDGHYYDGRRGGFHGARRGNDRGHRGSDFHGAPDGPMGAWEDDSDAAGVQQRRPGGQQQRPGGQQRRQETSPAETPTRATPQSEQDGEPMPARMEAALQSRSAASRGARAAAEERQTDVDAFRSFDAFRSSDGHERDVEQASPPPPPPQPKMTVVHSQTPKLLATFLGTLDEADPEVVRVREALFETFESEGDSYVPRAFRQFCEWIEAAEKSTEPSVGVDQGAAPPAVHDDSTTADGAAAVEPSLYYEEHVKSIDEAIVILTEPEPLGTSCHATLATCPILTRLDSTRLDSTRLDSTRLDSTRLGSARLDSTRLGSSRLDSTRLD